MRIVLLLALFVATFSSQAQKIPSWVKGNKPTVHDSVLYIYFDKGTAPPESKKSQMSSRFYKNGMYRKRESNCGYHKLLERSICPPSSYYIGENHFIGKTIDGYTLLQPDTVGKSLVRKYYVLSFETLSNFLKTSYIERKPDEYMPKNMVIEPVWPDPIGSESYWDNLKRIYIIEPVGKKDRRFIITEVERDFYIL